MAALILGAGAGTRLRPITRRRAKVLCPVDGVPLLELALERVASLTSSIAVNVRYDADAIVERVGARAHVSDERGHPHELGTAGAVGALRGWLDGRAVLVVNGDTWTTVDLVPLLDGWDGERVRVLVHGPPGTPMMPAATWERIRAANAATGRGEVWRAQPAPGAAEVVASLVPAGHAAGLPAAPLGLSNGLWWPAQATGRLEVIAGEGDLVACDTPGDYLRANLTASGGASVIGEGAVVDGEVERCVLWPGTRVHAGESLVDAVRCDARTTVMVRPGRQWSGFSAQ